jgi:protease-4
VPFFKGTLNKLGIEAQVIKHGKYKSAVEIYTNDKMSAENRQQVSVYVNSIWGQILKGISDKRKISVNQLNSLADNLAIANPEDCKKYGLVDSLLYADQVNADLLKRALSDAKEPEFVELAKYNKVPKQRTTKGLAKNKIALIYAVGDVVSGKGDNESIGSETIAKALRNARTDTSIKAIVFRINSPGGSALASEVIWREANLAAKEKVLVASMGDLAASGGYYIACPADTIMASPTTITGSIGVFGVIFNFKELLNNKLGITLDGVKTNTHADLPTVTRSMDESEKAFIGRRIERIYDSFITHVAEGRNMKKADVDNIAQGRVWTGADAVKIGLVDTLGGINDAILLAARMANITNYRVVEMPKQEDPFEKLINSLMEDVKTSWVKNELGEEYKYLKACRNVLKHEGIQARFCEVEIK